MKKKSNARKLELTGEEGDYLLDRALSAGIEWDAIVARFRKNYGYPEEPDNDAVLKVDGQGFTIEIDRRTWLAALYMETGVGARDEYMRSVASEALADILLDRKARGLISEGQIQSHADIMDTLDKWLEDL